MIECLDFNGILLSFKTFHTISRGRYDEHNVRYEENGKIV